MKFGTNYFMRQIKIPNETYLKIKYYCQHNQISLASFYEIMLDWFLDEYALKNNVMFQASRKHHHTLSLWIKGRQIAEISKLASEAKVADARVIYTAMMLYLENTPEFQSIIF